MREGRWLATVEVSTSRPGMGVTRQLVKRRRNRFNPALGRGNARAAWADTLARYLAGLRVTLAGPLAEAKALNRPLRAVGAVYDFEECQQLVPRLEALREFAQDQGVDCGPPIVERFNEERRRVRRWIARPINWNAIEKIARALMQQRRITAREVFACYLESRAAHQQSLPLSWDLPELDPGEPVRRRAA